MTYIKFNSHWSENTASLARTPYDSPAMWKARPLNFVKFSKNIDTKAAMSFAASSVVP
jgi:hypothetical protein